MMNGAKPGRRLLLPACLAILLICATPSAAQQAPLLSYTYTYAEAATFRLNLVDQSASDQATLLLQINEVATSSETVPIENGSAAITRDLSRAPFPPFSEITYWWAFETAHGRWEETEKQAFRYVDNRYTWKRLATDAIRVHWISGDADTMAAALEVAAETVSELSAALQAPIKNNVDIFVYPSERDLDLALQLGGQTQVSGVAYPQFGVILTVVPPDISALSAIQRNIPHELTHQALYDLLGAQGYAALPTWLDEGLATIFETSPNPTYAQAIAEAQEANELIPLNDLCAPFPEEPRRARLAYAQSAGIVRYIQREYGWARIRALLDAYADGQACSTGVQNVLGVDIRQLEQEWQNELNQHGSARTTLTARSQVQPLLHDLGPWIVILGALCLTPLLTLTIGQRR